MDLLFGALQQQLITGDGSAKNRKQLLRLLNDLWRTHNQLRQADQLRAIDKSLARHSGCQQLIRAVRQIADNAAAAATTTTKLDQAAIPRPSTLHQSQAAEEAERLCSWVPANGSVAEQSAEQRASGGQYLSQSTVARRVLDAALRIGELEAVLSEREQRIAELEAPQGQERASAAAVCPEVQPVPQERSSMATAAANTDTIKQDSTDMGNSRIEEPSNQAAAQRISHASTFSAAELERYLRNLFSIVDATGDWVLQPQELTKLLQLCGFELSAIEIAEFVRVADGDGVIAYNEFVRVASKMLQSQKGKKVSAVVL